MDETILLPSPNWFQVSNLAVSTDGWLIYGGPSKSLCVLEPRKADNGIISSDDKYQAHVVIRAHPEKIVSIDVSPEWLEKRYFLTGSSDGCVKQWVLETVNNRIKIKATHSHEVHQQEKEEIAGVGYSNETTAITVGCFSNIVKWDLSSNVAKTYPNFMKNFKPTCMACSLHVPLNVAVGTKQGVVFLLDLNGNGKILYKVRSQDDEVMNVSWCPQYEISVKKTLKESENRTVLSSRLAAIRNIQEKEPNVLEQSGVEKNLPEDSFDESVVQEDDMFDIYKDHEPDEFGHKKYEPEDIVVKVKQEKADVSDYLAECLKLKEEILKRKNQEEPSIESLVNALDNTHVESDAESQPQSAQAMTESTKSEENTSAEKCDKTEAKPAVEFSAHVHKHLLATIGKYGGVRVWSKSGKLVGSCAIPNNVKNQGKKAASWPTLLWYKPDSLLIVDGKSQLLECNPLKIDCKNKLEWRVIHALHKRGMYCIKSNAPRVQTEDTSGDWSVWSLSQDRNIIRYCFKSKKTLGVHATCGGFLYTVQPCPYDAGRVAISVGDGAVRIWESSTLVDDDMKLTPAHVTTYWQNVQGKVLTVAWHPTKENLLAFATAEARVGLIDTSGKSEKPARVLLSALNNAVYSVCWGENMHLYASGGGSLVVYRADQTDQAPEPIEVELEGQKWNICAVNWTARGLLCGSFTGAVAVLTPRPPHTLVTATFIFNKMIHAIEWHPEQTSSSTDESQYKDLIAVSSLDRENTVIILEFGTKEDGTKQLTTWKTLVGHKMPVLQIAWNPHRDEQLLSTSQDSTVRVWDISTGSCISIFGNHSQSAVGAAWVSLPQLPNYIMSGGGDACLRLWDVNKHKAENYDETKHEITSKKQVKKSTDKKEKKVKEDIVQIPGNSSSEDQELIATSCEVSSNRSSKAPKKFLLPILFKQINDPCKIPAPKKMLQIYVQKTDNTIAKGDGVDTVVQEKDSTKTVDEKGDANTLVQEKEEENNAVEEKHDDNTTNVKEIDVDFLKIFGTINELNEFLDLEMENHLAANHLEAWIMLAIFRGQIDTMIQFATQRDMLCPFLLSVAPCVSFKYWRDVSRLYLAQIDRLAARGEEDKLYENRYYGGPVYRKTAILLSMHDIKGAVNALIEGKLFKEAYILCRLRYMDVMAEDTLKQWAYDLAFSGQLSMSAVCYIALGDLSQAAQVLARAHDQECLSLAAEIAKIAGRTTFADHVQKKALSKSQETDKTDEFLKQLPSKIELLMKEADKAKISDTLESDTINGVTLNSDKLNGDTEIKE